MALIKMVQSMTQLLQNPVEVFRQEILQHFATSGWRLAHRLEGWLELNDAADRAARLPSPGCRGQQLPQPVAHSSPTGPLEEEEGEEEEDEEEVVTGLGTSKVDGSQQGALEDSGLCRSSAATTGGAASSQQELSQDCWESEGASGGSRVGGAVGGGPAPSTSSAAVPSPSPAAPAVRPKKRRKSYRSFLPEGSGYPDIGFPLFPLSKGFVKSVRSVLLQYRAALTSAGLPENCTR